MRGPLLVVHVNWAGLRWAGCGGKGQLPPQSQDSLGCSLLNVGGHRCAQFRVDTPTVNIRRTIPSFSSNKHRNMIKTCLASNGQFHEKHNLSYKDLLIKDNELPPYLPKGIYCSKNCIDYTAISFSRSQAVDP